MNACQIASLPVFPRPQSHAELQQVNQSISHTEDGSWFMVNILEDKLTTLDDFG